LTSNSKYASAGISDEQTFSDKNVALNYIVPPPLSQLPITPVLGHYA